MAVFTGRTFEGYKLVDVVASGVEEVLYLAERVRDGGRVWVRTAKLVEPDPAHERLRQRYDAEKTAAVKVASTGGAILPVREVIELDGVPAIVTDIPKGRSLNDVFADGSQELRLLETLPWLRRLMTTVEAAHNVGAAHGSLGGRAVYLDEDRVTVCGLAVMEGERLKQAMLSDVVALSSLMYHATCGNAPRPGFPDTGMPVSPEHYVDGYPASLARFLRRRLAKDQAADPVENAGIFRRSIDALSVDPQFRKAAGVVDEDAHSQQVVIQKRKIDWQGLKWPVALGGLAVGVSVLITFMVMEVRIEEAKMSAARPTAPTKLAVAPAAPETNPRLAAWRCVHARFTRLEDGPIAPRGIRECMRLAPHVTIDELRTETALILEGLESTPRPNDGGISAAAGYKRMFIQGPDAVAQHVRYRLDRDLPIDELERWLAANPATQNKAVLTTLSAGQGKVAAWSKRALQRAGVAPQRKHR